MPIHQYWGDKLPYLPLGYQKSKLESELGQHLAECCGSSNRSDWKNLKAHGTVEKLIIIEARYISKLKPGLNIYDEYQGR